MPGLVFASLGVVMMRIPAVEIVQNERRAGDRKRLMDGAGKWCTLVDDVNGTESEPVIDLVLLPGCDAGKPPRVGVIGLR